MHARELAAPVADRTAGRTANRAADAAPVHRGAWRQPVVWLALAVFVASLLGCIGMIVLANRLADPEVPVGPVIMKVPLERQPLPSRPEPAPPAAAR